MESSWQTVTDFLILLTAALLLGTLAERLRQSAILGYLLAGTLVGPNVLALVSSGVQVEVFAELGVALLLFTIGLDFSFRRLRHLGIVALIGGSLQVVVSLIIFAAAVALMGLNPPAALAMGTIVTMSSTACVVRLLMDRAQLDSIHGRNALGMLLLQDAAVIPLILMMAALRGGRSPDGDGLSLLQTALLAVALIGLFYVLLVFVVPQLFNIRQWVKNRDLPILLAIVIALGAVVAAHRVGISPATGAFIAGVLLGQSPFAVQIRADVSSIRTLLVTVFFTAIGLLGDPLWVMDHWRLVAATVAAIVIGKALIIAIILRLLRLTLGLAVATGLCLAQVGEFSFVLAAIARDGLIGQDLFSLIISAIVVTLLLTPFLVNAAPLVASRIDAWQNRRVTSSQSPGGTTQTDQPQEKVFIIGFGPAGQRVAQALLNQYQKQIVVIDLNWRNTTIAMRDGLATQLGDASRREVLEHAQIHVASVIVITVPDTNTSRAIIHHCKYLAPSAVIVARARYHALSEQIQSAGALEVVDEEENVGLRLAAEARKHMRGEDGQG